MINEKKTFHQFSNSLASLTLKKVVKNENDNTNESETQRNELEELLVQLKQQSSTIKSIVPLSNRNPLNSYTPVKSFDSSRAQPTIEQKEKEVKEFPNASTEINEISRTKQKVVRQISQMESVLIDDDLNNDKSQSNIKDKENKQKKDKQSYFNANKNNDQVNREIITNKKDKTQMNNKQIIKDTFNQLSNKIENNSGLEFPINDSLQTNTLFSKDKVNTTLTKNNEKEEEGVIKGKTIKQQKEIKTDSSNTKASVNKESNTETKKLDPIKTKNKPTSTRMKAIPNPKEEAKGIQEGISNKNKDDLGKNANDHPVLKSKTKQSQLSKSSSAKQIHQIKEVATELEKDQEEELNKTQTKTNTNINTIMVNSFFPSSAKVIEKNKEDNQINNKVNISLGNMIEEDIEEINELRPEVNENIIHNKTKQEQLTSTNTKKKAKEKDKSKEKLRESNESNDLDFKANTFNNYQINDSINKEQDAKANKTKLKKCSNSKEIKTKKEENNSNKNKQKEKDESNENIENHVNDNNSNKRKGKGKSEKNVAKKASAQLSEEDLKAKIELIIKGIKDFDILHPNLKQEEYSFVSSYTLKEQHSLDIIKKYQKEFEGKEITCQRRNNFLNSNYFTTLIDNNNPNPNTSSFSSFVSRVMESCFTSKYGKYKNYSNELSQIITDNQTSTTKGLFKKQNTESNLLIDNIEHISTFYYKYSLHERWEILLSSMKTFEYWRQVHNDGNSFYRVLMFSIIEYIIIHKEIQYLIMIYKEIEALSEHFVKEKIEYDKALISFKLIIEYLSNKEETKAYKLFIKAFNQSKNDVFDKVLVIYLKIIAIDYLKKVYKLKEDSEKQNNEIDTMTNNNENNNSIFKNGNNNYNKTDKTMKRNVSIYYENNIDPDINIIPIIHYLFNIDIEVFCLDGLFDNPKFGSISYKKHQKEQPLNITIGFFFSSYFILYSSIDQIESTISKEILSNTQPNLFTQLTFTDQSNKNNCSRCGRLSSKIYFLQKGFSACIECLKEHIDCVMNERAKVFMQSNFLGLEYHTRDIQLNDKYSLSTYEYIEIDEYHNFTDFLLNKVKGLCFNCFDYINPDRSNTNRNQLTCYCCYCNKCLLEKQLKATNNLKAINAYEKNTIKSIPCACGKKYDPDEGMEYIEDITENDVQRAIKRMFELIHNKCLKCEKEMKESNILNFRYLELKKEDIPPLNTSSAHPMKKDNLTLFSSPHMICMSCYKIERAKDKAERKVNKGINRKKDAKCLECKLCFKTHYFNLITWEEDGEGACCTETCIMF